MKKSVFTISMFIFIALSFTTVLAQDEDATSPADIVTPSITESISNENIQDFKDNLASKFAELNKNKKAAAGFITEIKDNKIKIKTNENSNLDIKIDPDLTKIYNIEQSGLKELKMTDLKNSAYIIVVGLPLENTINANYIYQDKPFVVKSGKIVEVSKSDYSLKVTTTDKDDYTLDVESSTKQQIMNIKTLEVGRVGFSKIKEGDTIHFSFALKESNAENNRYSVTRFLIIPQEYF